MSGQCVGAYPDSQVWVQLMVSCKQCHILLLNIYLIICRTILNKRTVLNSTHTNNNNSKSIIFAIITTQK